MIVERDGAVTFDVRVKPRASRDAVVGIEGDVVVIAVRAAPVDGEANRALVEALAQGLGVPRRDVEIVRGETGRRKTVRVRGASRARVLALMYPAGPRT